MCAGWHRPAEGAGRQRLDRLVAVGALEDEGVCGGGKKGEEEEERMERALGGDGVRLSDGHWLWHLWRCLGKLAAVDVPRERQQAQ